MTTDAPPFQKPQERHALQRALESSATAMSADRQLVEQLLRRGLIETPDFHAFWGYFVAALTRDLSNVPNEDPALTTKLALASYLIAALTKNFYGGTAEEFYWQAGNLRQGVFRVAQDYGFDLMPAHFYSPVPQAKGLPADFLDT